jgi:hypothetical protein
MKQLIFKIYNFINPYINIIICNFDNERVFVKYKYKYKYNKYKYKYKYNVNNHCDDNIYYSVFVNNKTNINRLELKIPEIDRFIQQKIKNK